MFRTHLRPWRPGLGRARPQLSASHTTGVPQVSAWRPTHGQRRARATKLSVPRAARHSTLRAGTCASRRAPHRARRSRREAVQAPAITMLGAGPPAPRSALHKARVPWRNTSRPSLGPSRCATQRSPPRTGPTVDSTVEALTTQTPHVASRASRSAPSQRARPTVKIPLRPSSSRRSSKTEAHCGCASAPSGALTRRPEPDAALAVLVPRPITPARPRQYCAVNDA